jgi:hypothetical protein
MALGLDFLTQVSNVQWESGLAVEFGNKDQDAPNSAETRAATMSKKK